MKIWIKKYGFQFVIICAILLGTIQVDGLNKKELLNRRKKLAKKIEATQALLKDIQKDKKATIGEYRTMKAEIEQRTELINTIKTEIETTEKSILSTQDTIEYLQKDLTRFKGDYSNMMRHAYRHRNANKRALFVLSANSFNDALRRWRYFVRYDEQRKHQITLVGTTQQSLNQKIIALKATRDSNKELLTENEQQNEKRTNALEKQTKLLEKLKGKEQEIKADLAEKEEAKTRLTDAIDIAIRKDLRKNQASSRVKGVETTKKLSAKDKKIGKLFRKAKRKLPMPVKGVITGKYGTQKHPTLKKITIKNNGIDIKTYANSKVKSIFQGEVINVFAIPGSQNAIMIRHGNYYSVYSNLKQVNVSNGQKIKQGQVIGVVGISPKTKQSELHLEIWKDSKHLNPSSWLKK